MIMRCATVDDAAPILDLLSVAHAKSARAVAEIDRGKALKSIIGFISEPSIFSNVLVSDGNIEGVLFGAVVAPYYSKQKQATDIEFYVSPDHRGHGVKLEVAFDKWAKGFDSVVEFQRCITVGGQDADNAEAFYSARGYSPVGRIMTKRAVK